MDAAAQLLRQNQDVPSSEPVAKDTQKSSIDDMELEKSISFRRSSDGPPPFNRTRSFKTKQLVRSQAIKESHSPPRQPSPRPGEKIKIMSSVKKKSASIDSYENMESKMKNLVLADKDQDRSVSPSNNNNVKRSNMNLPKPDRREDTSPAKGNKFRNPTKSPNRVEFQQVEIQVSSGDADASNQPTENRGSQIVELKNGKKQDTLSIDNDPEIKEINYNNGYRRNGEEFVRRIPSKQDSGISCWESFTGGDESICISDTEDDSRIREEGDQLHHLADPCDDKVVDKWANKKTGATLSVARNFNFNSVGNPRLMRKQSSGGSIDSGHYSLASPYMSRDNSCDLGYYRHIFLDKFELVDFIKETLNKTYRDRVTLLKLESQLVNFVKDPCQRELVFHANSSYGRLLIHRCADLFGLRHGIIRRENATVHVTKPTYGCGIPAIVPFSQWCEEIIPPPSPIMFHDDPLPAKSILKRDAHSLDEDGLPNSNTSRISKQTRSKSFEQREEEYERARRRIFSSPGTEQDDRLWDWRTPKEQDNMQNEITKPMVLIARPDEKPRLFKGHSLEQQSENMVGSRAPVSKAHSFGGYGGRQNSVQGGPEMRREDSISSTHSAPPTTILSRRGEAARNNWLSPGSSGYKTLSGHTDSITPSPTATPTPSTADAGNKNTNSGNNTAGDGNQKSSVLWVVTDMSNVPVGAVIIHPETGQALKNSDGSVYHYDPEKPPHTALLQTSQLSVDGQKEKRKSRLEKQQAMLSPGVDQDLLSPIDKRLLSDSREYSPIKSPKSEQCDPIMEDDFSVSDASSHSHCQCCRDEQKAAHFPACEEPQCLKEEIQEPAGVTNNANIVIENIAEDKSPEPCTECVNLERREDYQPMYRDHEEVRFYENMLPDPNCCEQQQYENQSHEAESYPIQDPNMQYNMHQQVPQMMYGMPQDPNVAYAPSAEMIYQQQMMYQQAYRMQEGDVHAPYQMMPCQEQVSQQMLITVPKPPEHEVPAYMTYPGQNPMDTRAAQIQHLAYQMPSWNCWPQMAMYNQQAPPPAEEPMPKVVNSSAVPSPYMQIQGDPSMAIPQVFYQHPANLLPQQHTQYVYNQTMPMSVPHMANQPQYPLYQAYPPPTTLYNVPPPTGLVKSPDKANFPPTPKSPKQSPASTSLRNTPLNEAGYCPQEMNYLPYYTQQNMQFPAYYQACNPDCASVESSNAFPKEEPPKRESPKPINEGGLNFYQKQEFNDKDKKVVPHPITFNPTNVSSSPSTNQPVRVITPQGDVIRYNNPNAKLTNFQFDKNVNMDKILAERREEEKKVPVKPDQRESILGSPDHRFGWTRQHSFRDYKTYHNFPKNFRYNMNKKFNKDRLSTGIFDKSPSVDMPNSPLQRNSPGNAFYWNQRNQNEKPAHILQRSQSQSTQSPPLLPFPTSPGLLPGLFHVRPNYNQARRNPRHPHMPQLPGSPSAAIHNLPPSSVGLIQAAALQNQNELFFRQFPWLRRAAAAPPLLGPAPSLVSAAAHGRHRMPRPNGQQLR